MHPNGGAESKDAQLSDNFPLLKCHIVGNKDPTHLCYFSFLVSISETTIYANHKNETCSNHVVIIYFSICDYAKNTTLEQSFWILLYRFQPRSVILSQCF